MEDRTLGGNVGQATLRAELVARAAAIVPLLRANAPKADEMRRLPHESIAAMEAAGLFRICTPKQFGGYESDVRTYTDVVAEIGRGCGSSAWISMSLHTVDTTLSSNSVRATEILSLCPTLRLANRLELEFSAVADRS